MSRWMKMAFLIVIAAAFAVPVVAQDTGIEVVGGDEAQLRELLSRIVVPLYFGQTANDEGPRITVGALPDDLPFEIPVPDNAEVLGGMANLGTMRTGQIYLNAPGSLEEIRDFYAEALKTAGWHDAPNSQPRSGFLPEQPLTLAYCSRDNETLLTVALLGSNEEVAPVNIYWQDAYTGACESDPRISSGINPIIPLIAQPPGTQIHGGSSGGGGDDGSFISATLTTDQSAEALANYYTNQLVEQSWEMTGESNTDVSTTSTWTTTDADGDTWLGVLLVVDAGDDQRTAFFQATRQRL